MTDIHYMIPFTGAFTLGSIAWPESKFRPKIYIQSWSELLAPLVNMIKEGSENKPALLILLTFYLKKNHKNLTKTIENGGNLIMK